MAIRIEKHFTIAAAPDAVWSFLTDPNRVVRCLPGAAITGQLDERTWGGTMTLKVGPVSSSYRGKITFQRLDAAGRTAELKATGQDVQGRGGADMTMTSSLAPSGSGTAVTVVSEVNVTGILAQFGRGMIQDVSDQMFGTFTANMTRELVSDPGGGGGGGAMAPAAPPALDVVSLGARVLLRRPAFWVALAVLAILVYLLWGR